MTKIQAFSNNLLSVDMTLGSNSQLFPIDSDRISQLCTNSVSKSASIIIFHFNFTSNKVILEKRGILQNVTLIEGNVENSINFSSESIKNTSSGKFSLTKENHQYSFSFSIFLTKNKQAGLYSLTFHNCDMSSNGIGLSVSMIEKNKDSFLSVGEMPFPNMYYSLFVFTLLFSIIWLIILCRSKENVFKVHYLMLVLMFIKAISLLFHGINYHFIDVHGEKEETFAILFYIIYLTKGILMFVTIVLIGTGWTFIKHILSENEKKIFVIIIPLQILTNVAHIIMFETEESQANYNVWYKIFMFVDFVCCVAIMLPVFWSIRHLQQASSVDGKAAINLEKLKIFRHFYMMVVFYIYFTRIIVLMLTYTIPFRYTWLSEFLVELATIFFFILTGFKFRPASNNPYLRVSTSDDEEEEEAVTQSGAYENVTRIKFKSKKLRTEQDLEMEEPMIPQENDEIN